MKILGDRVLIRPSINLNEHGEEVSESGIILKTDPEVKAMRDNETIGVVVDYGPGAWLRDDLGGEPQVERGEEVIYAKYAGKFIQFKGEELVVIRDEDVLISLGGDSDGDE